MCIVGLFVLSACSKSDNDNVDRLNDYAYSQHYRDLNKVDAYADSALTLCSKGSRGYAEALNNKAFVAIMKMQYAVADSLLKEISENTDNQIELLISDIQMMRVCQRQSYNKEFYDFYGNAERRLQRISEEIDNLDKREKQRLEYAKSEMSIVASTYFYYVGLQKQSVDALLSIDGESLLSRDTAQYLNYIYNIGAGGILTGSSPEDVSQMEFDHLIRCLLMSQRNGYVFFEANALEALSEHLMDDAEKRVLIDNNMPAMKFLDVVDIPDSIIPIVLAERSLGLFVEYGDVYQIAGAYRTLASSYFVIEQYEESLYNLQLALNNNLNIDRAPDLVASIREQLSMTYSALNDKKHSDYNRNIYLDMRETSRQDRYLEARAEQLDKTSTQLNIMLAAVILAILLLIFLLWRFNKLRNDNQSKEQLSKLLIPLRQWQKNNEQSLQQLQDTMDEIDDKTRLNELRILDNRKKNVENRAKTSLIVSITPFIDRIIHEISNIKKGNSNEQLNEERYNYVGELIGQIEAYNNVITDWIKLEQGQISLHIESFPLSQLFDIVDRSKMSFSLKGIQLRVVPNNFVVKADKILTLFMINTMADNARKFTPKDGQVTISASQSDDYVEISIEDTGCGIEEEKLKDIFNHKVYQGHGFGLMNCKGIIERYKKVSKIFSVCTIGAESEKGKGSRFFFRLPYVVKMLLLMLAMSPILSHAQDKASMYADSAYYSNIAGTYEKTLTFSDSCFKYLNHDGRSNKDYYSIAADINNESAVAALALKEWNLYKKYNEGYSKMFKLMSSDDQLETYCGLMKRSETNKNIAIVLLIMILLCILPAYYLLYYRQKLFYRSCLEKVSMMNDLLLSDIPSAEKLSRIRQISIENFPQELYAIVKQIDSALQINISDKQQLEDKIEMAGDELQRSEYENDQLYISNKITDNCLSTLKHETMYYPSRIQQLLVDKGNNITAIDEVARYYKAIYDILTRQTSAQTEKISYHIEKFDVDDVSLMADTDMMKFLFGILKKQNSNESLIVTCREKETDRIDSNEYGEITIVMTALNNTAKTASDLFTPTTDHIPYLICRQIIRDHGEVTSHRGCGISACVNEEGKTEIKILLPLWKNSK